MKWAKILWLGRVQLLVLYAFWGVENLLMFSTRQINWKFKIEHDGFERYCGRHLRCDGRSKQLNDCLVVPDQNEWAKMPSIHPIRTIQSNLVIESRANGTYIFFLLVLLLFLCPYILPDFEKSQRRAHSACTTFSRNELTLKLFVLGVVERIERVWSTSNFFAFELEKRSTEKKYSLT